MTTTPKKPSYKDATGHIEFTLKSDIVFHYTMQRSKKALLGLVCALRGISPSQVQDIRVENPIDLNSIGRETVMDLKLILNSGVIMNIELQMYTDSFWIPRSILYLCRAFDSIKKGEDYSLLKETVHYCITDQNLIKASIPEFYAKYKLLNENTHEQYSNMLGLNVLQLNNRNLATKEDIDHGLAYWSDLFMATTWEELHSLIQDHDEIEEVAEMIFTLNTDDQSKEILEGQRRYREQLATQYAAGKIDAKKEYEEKLAEKDAVIAMNEAALAEKEAILDKNKAALAGKDAQIAALMAEIEELKKK